jgi:2-polyprenyl-6-methoxyphenol hydroxylase-like FAD-dependent oxidoreductase
MSKRMDIAIVGAGIGGLTAAAALAALDHRITLFDRFETPRPVGSGLVIQPVGQHVLDQIGAGVAARGFGRAIYHMQGLEADSGRTVLSVRYGPQDGARFGLAIQRPALFQTVFDAAMAAGANLELSRPVQERDGTRLIFEGGSSEGPFDLIIDASGTNSSLSPLQARALPFGAVWGTVPWPKGATLPKGLFAQRYRRASQMVGVMPSGTRPEDAQETATIFWSLPVAGFDEWRTRGRDTWLTEVESTWSDALPFFEQITDLNQMSTARYSHGTLRRTTAPGFATIGDAAHRASPQLGQGANMAMLDAWALALAIRRFPLGEALHHFERARRWHVRIYQAMSWAFTPQYQSDSRVLPILRDRVLYPISAIPPIPNILTKLVCGDLIPPHASLDIRAPR